MQCSNHIDAFGHPIAFEFEKNGVSKCCGLLHLRNIVEKTGLIDRLAALLDKYWLRRIPFYKFTNAGIVAQIIYGLSAGYGDLTDAELMKLDPAFRHCLKEGVASAPTLSRFYAKLAALCEEQQNEQLAAQNKTRDDLKTFETIGKTDPLRVRCALFDRLNEELLTHCIKILKTQTPEHIVVDVDSTPIPQFGKQEGRSYDAHYAVSGLLPILVTINGVSALVQGAPGAGNGASLFALHVDALLRRLKEEFPGKLIVVRADTGFGNEDLVRSIRKADCKFLLGCNACGGRYILPKVIQYFRENCSLEEAKRLKLPQAFLSLVYSDEFELVDDNFNLDPFRCCGLVRGYKATSWSEDRTVVYRLNFNPEHKDQVDFRFISTNLSHDELIAITKMRGMSKQRSTLENTLERDQEDAEFAIELYEGLFSDRGMDERLNCEWKSMADASRCSMNSFWSNSIRMIFCAFVQQIFEIVRQHCCRDRKEPTYSRRSIKPNQTSSHQGEKAWCGPTLKSMRQFLIRSAGIIRIVRGRVVMSLAHLPKVWEARFKRMASLTDVWGDVKPNAACLS